MSSKTYRWVPRNEDKPHRCPECHSVAVWWGRPKQHWGPRSVIACDFCRLRWRAGNRWPKNKDRRLDRDLGLPFKARWKLRLEHQLRRHSARAIRRAAEATRREVENRPDAA